MSIQESKNYAAPRPTLATLFFRRFIPWQVIRFLMVNIQMTVMILKSHGRRLPLKKNTESVETQR